VPEGSRVKIDSHTACAECLAQSGVLGASEAVVDDRLQRVDSRLLMRIGIMPTWRVADFTNGLSSSLIYLEPSSARLRVSSNLSGRRTAGTCLLLNARSFARLWKGTIELESSHRMQRIDASHKDLCCQL
jgi:hypothetical protein